MLSIKEMVKDKKVRFKCYKDGELWYETQDGFEFPIPSEDLKGATFLAEDKAILFMRWIRRHLNILEQKNKGPDFSEDNSEDLIDLE